MIASLRGNIIYKDMTSLIIECAGVGYQVFVTTDFLASSVMDEEVRIFTYHQVREDGQALFGFASMDEKILFEKLLGVSGVGPKAAISILSYMGSEGLKMSVVSSDAKAIAKAPGIGAKTAQKIILELKDKVDLMETLNPAANKTEMVTSLSSNMSDAIMALVSLGYTQGAAANAVRGIDRADELSADELLSLALKRI